jgi:flagellar basal-body rod protein FlgG
MRHETIVQNLANVRTVGYKADRATLTDFPSMLLTQTKAGEAGPEVGKIGTGVSMAAITTDFDDGPLKLTDHPMDLAIAGDGFFRLETPDGVRYTRDGRFHRNIDGHLITADGNYVLGANGRIVLPEGELTVSPRGEVFVDDTSVDQISLAYFDDPANLIKDGQTTFNTRGAEPQLMAAQDIQIYQGYLEESNVDTAQAVTEMTTVLRAYQASQRLVQFQDRINQQTVNELGRV